MDANPKWLIVMNNAYYGLNMPKNLKNSLFLMKKLRFEVLVKFQFRPEVPSAWSPFGLK